MLRPVSEFQVLSVGVGRYTDPDLLLPGAMLELAIRMHLNGRMLAASHTQIETVDFFAVVKKLVEVFPEPAGARKTTSGASPPTSSSSSPGFSAPGTGTGNHVTDAIDGRHWCIIQRLIMDERVPNLRWRTPPRIMLTSGEAISDLDFSKTNLRGGSVAHLKADAPDYYYRLRLEPWMVPFFIMEGITVTQLNSELRRRGHPLLEFEEGQDDVGIQVFLMGWSWSVWAAETVMEDMLIRGSSLLLASARLRHGSPSPAVGPDVPIPWFTHIDDLGAWIWGANDRLALERARMVLTEIRRVFAAAGLAIHKEEIHFMIGLVGLETGRALDGAMRTMAKPSSLQIITAGTAAVLARDLRDGGVIPADVESLAGHWSYRILINRAGFSVFQHLYLWIRRFRGLASGVLRKLWAGLRGELRCMNAIGPAIFMEQDLEWGEEAFTTDSSLKGFGVCVTPASREEQVEAGRFAEQKGWFFPVHPDGLPADIAADAPYPLEDQLPPEADDISQLKIREKAAWEEWEDEYLNSSGTLELGSGTGRWSEEVRRSGICRAVEIDELHGLHQDMTQGFLQQQLLRELHQGEHWALVISLSSGTFSRSCKWTCRSTVFPQGVPHLPLQLQQRVTKEDNLLNFALHFAETAFELGVWVFLEWSAGTLLDNHPAVRSFDQRTANFRGGLPPVSFDFCPFGTGSRRRTQVRTNASWFSAIALQCPGCPDHSSIRHVPPEERAGAYPSGLVTTWVAGLVAAGLNSEFQVNFPDRGLRGPGPTFQHSPDQASREQKKPPPSLSEQWAGAARWKVAIRGVWNREEHINVLEARSALMAVRRAARNPRNWKRKLLGLTDSSAVRGCFSKGRSSAASLVRPCRRLASIQLALRIRMRWRYIESLRNNADGPSRGWRVPGVKT